MGYDLFLSYSRRDNVRGRVSELKRWLETSFAEATGEKLNIFFDATEIKGMDDWRQRILAALADSHLLMICLSPAYLHSDYCSWEFNEYIKHEAARGVLGEGIAPVYFVDIKDFDHADYGESLTHWVGDLRRRQRIDLRGWSGQTCSTIPSGNDVQNVEALVRQIWQRLNRMRRVASSKGNVKQANDKFVGRIAELRRLQELIDSTGGGRIAVLHGLGGLGKTALAQQFAHSYAYKFSGGRWNISCRGQDDLRAALVSIVGTRDIAFDFSERERTSLDFQFERVLRELEQRAVLAAIRDDIGNPIEEGRVLLILDNVDTPSLLGSEMIERLPRANWLRVIATTRLGPDELADVDSRCFLAVEQLPIEDAVQLIQNYQPRGAFRDDFERTAAAELASLLGGFTLAIESAASFLGYFTEVSCKNFLERLRSDGVLGLDAAAMESPRGVRHVEKGLRATLDPTLQRLDVHEMAVIRYAAMLPPDQIALPWLRGLAGNQFPDLSTDAGTGMPDPWQSVLRRLLGLRLFQVAERDPTDQPRVVRMHRMVQQVIECHGSAEPILAEIIGYARARRSFLHHEWMKPKNRWEIVPLVAFSRRILDRGDEGALHLAEGSAGFLIDLCRFSEAEVFITAAERGYRSLVERGCTGLERELAAALMARSRLLWRDGRHQEALQAGDSGIAIYRKISKHDTPDPMDAHNLAECLRNRQVFLHDLGRLDEALVAIDEAVAIRRSLLGQGDTRYEERLASFLNNRASLLSDLERPSREVTDSLLESIGIVRRMIEQGRVDLENDLANSLMNYGVAQWGWGRSEEAVVLHEEVIQIRRRLMREGWLELEEDLAHALMNHGNALVAIGRADASLISFKEAIEIRRRLVQGGRQDVINHLAASLQYQGEAQAQLGELDAAIGSLSESVQIRQGLIREGRAEVESHLAQTITSYGHALLAAKRTGSIEAFGEAAEIYRRLVEKGQRRFDEDMARALVQYGAALASFSQFETALIVLEKAIGFWQRLKGIAARGADAHLVEAQAIKALVLLHLDRSWDAIAAINEVIPQLHPGDQVTVNADPWVRAMGIRFDAYLAVAQWEAAARDACAVAHFRMAASNLGPLPSKLESRLRSFADKVRASAEARDWINFLFSGMPFEIESLLDC